MDAPEVLIVGAGPAGLTAAIEMHRFGIPCRLIDKAPHGAKYSQALVVQARTLEQWERYGIAQHAVDNGKKLKQSSMFSDGKLIFTFVLDKIPGRYPFVLFFPQNETEQLLTGHLQSLGGEIEREVELAAIENHGSSSRIQLRHSDGGSEELTVRWVIGCDGAHSAVRELLGIPFAGEQVALHFYLGDLEIEGEDKPGDEIRIYLHHGDVVFIGRLSEKIYRVIVALHPGQSAPTSGQLTLADFQGPMDRASVNLRAVSAEWMTPFHVNDREAKHTRLGNVFLAGDASHIHSPVGGQGMNTGIQDVANLAWKIAAVRNGAGADLLDSYTQERGKVSKALLKMTSNTLKGGTTDNPIIEKVRDFIFSTAAKIPQVQQAVAGFISETAIEYRDSPVVVDCGGPGSIHAGDRVPNPELEWTDGRRSLLLEPLARAQHLSLTIGPGCTIDPERLTPASREEVARLFGAEDRVLVIRPDGYLGFRGSIARDRAKLADYTRRTIASTKS